MGSYVVIEPVAPAHADALHAATLDPSLWTYRTDEPPTSVDELSRRIEAWAAARDAITFALRLFAGYLFENLGYRRFEWKLDSGNAPSAAAARRFGFRYEGRFRNALVYKGRNRDTDWFAMTDADWARLAPAYDTWLDPANFDPQGRQLARLADHVDSGAVGGP